MPVQSLQINLPQTAAVRTFIKLKLKEKANLATRLPTRCLLILSPVSDSLYATVAEISSPYIRLLFAYYKGRALQREDSFCRCSQPIARGRLDKALDKT